MACKNARPGRPRLGGRAKLGYVRFNHKGHKVNSGELTNTPPARDARAYIVLVLLRQIHMLHVFDRMPQESLTQAAEFFH